MMIVAIITRANGDDDYPKEFARPIEFSLKWRSLIPCLLQEPGDASHFGLHPGRGHDSFTVSVSSGRPAENHVVAVTQRHVIGNDIGRLGDWQAFAGERGLSGLEGCRFHQPSVSRNGVAFLDQDDVAGDDFGGGDAESFSVSDNRSVRCRHRSQGRYRGLGSRFLNVAQAGVEQDDRQDRNCFVRKARVTLVGPQAGGDTGGDEQQDDEDVLKLREEPHPRRGRLLRRELVAPVPFKSRSDLGVGQATPEVGSQHRDNVIGVSSVWLAWIHDTATLHMFRVSHSDCGTRGSTVAPHGSSESISRDTCSFRSASPNA
jgi:hypothetical protein